MLGMFLLALVPVWLRGLVGRARRERLRHGHPDLERASGRASASHRARRDATELDWPNIAEEIESVGQSELERSNGC